MWQLPSRRELGAGGARQSRESRAAVPVEVQQQQQLTASDASDTGRAVTDHRPCYSDSYKDPTDLVVPL